ncbi:hypothetical protein SAMN02927900_04743 [Rhizobium mongolense subsp. loessense]|uniref:HEPN AbiJ-N-terminal domain-containing protein n=1 Tax=Rhizobium mongolense subsp. loessense TaxID=158890 RepID=A0A1G4T8U4_9HYPH|nr:hypothetical protein [Rhizobium mongolense]SCW76969.1 hypothetical protein SAMN02927900_04743 [Rhizobium mongolense subsp. loessense]
MDNERHLISFEQAEGLVPLPSQLKLKEVTPIIKSRLWNVVHQKIVANTGDYALLKGVIQRVARAYIIERTSYLIDEWNNKAPELTQLWRRHFLPQASYSETLGFIEWFLRQLQDEYTSKYVENILVRERAAYRLVSNSIMPIASPEEGQAIIQAVEKASALGLDGVRSHLTKASTHLTAGSFADSVRESIHAVEAIVFNKTGITGSFSAAIRELNKASPMHDAFREALVKLYGYTSNEQGVRHSLFDQGDANVTERDALFMLGICASFVTYLLKAEGAPKE